MKSRWHLTNVNQYIFIKYLLSSCGAQNCLCFYWAYIQLRETENKQVKDQKKNHVISDCDKCYEENKPGNKIESDWGCGEMGAVLDTVVRENFSEVISERRSEWWGETSHENI